MVIESGVQRKTFVCCRAVALRQCSNTILYLIRHAAAIILKACSVAVFGPGRLFSLAI